MDSKGSAILIGLIAVAVFVFLIWFLIKKTKRLNPDHVHLFTGGVGSGKTTLAVATAIRLHKRAHRAWSIRKAVCKPLNWVASKVFKRPDKFAPGEEPLLYSNIVLSYPYVPLTSALINREVRFNYKSVIFISESSLVADSFDIKNQVFNDNLNLFTKLIRHETHGGYLILETQSLSDNHFAVKRVLCSYTLISECIKWVPFVILFKTRELAYNADASVDVNNIFQDDIDKEARFVVVSKRVWKKFDSFTYSGFTDGLHAYKRVVVGDQKDLKTNYLLEVNKNVKNK